jgi:hypothetical protein
MTTPTITVTRNIGLNRGKPRLWIEGNALVEAGLDHGGRWDLLDHTSPDGFFISGNPDGKRKIAGKPGRPIIDMTGATLEKLGFSHGDTAVLEYTPGSGLIEGRRQLSNH